jgi:hypothetical protein
MRLFRFAVLGVCALGLLNCDEKPKGGGAGTPVPSSTVAASAASVAAAAPSALASSALTVARPAHSGAAKPRPAGSAQITIAGGADDARADAGAASKESAASVGLPAVDFGAPAPLVIKGYPEPLALGMRDYAQHMGYGADGAEAIACGPMAPSEMPKGTELGDTCFFRERTGKTQRLHGVETNAKGEPFVTPAFAQKLKVLKDGARVAARVDAAKNELLPPPVRTNWPYAQDVSLTLSKGSEGQLRIGGAVRGEQDVFPITLRVATIGADGIPFSGEWNAVVASPDNTELAFMGHFFCMEWCNEMVIERLSYGKLASLVFNDTGFRRHQKSDFAGSRDLFLKATWANPAAPLPPYNLACAYAQLKDETNAEKALKLAIAVGGDGVKARAKKDADFKGVTGAKWFVALTR